MLQTVKLAKSFNEYKRIILVLNYEAQREFY